MCETKNQTAFSLAARCDFSANFFMHQSVCVYCSSSDAVPERYFEAAREMGRLLAQKQQTLIYGGGKVGLMGALAASVHHHGGKVVGVIPDYLRLKEVCYEGADELIVTRDMRERKAIMESRADAFITLPGGFGTLEELMEILTLKQLGRHTKAVVLLNTGGFFNPLADLFEQLYVEQFTKEQYREYYHLAATPEEAISYLDHYRPPAHDRKWF
jgi:uncharacterized protein (TIGR00730 family)